MCSPKVTVKQGSRDSDFGALRFLAECYRHKHQSRCQIIGGVEILGELLSRSIKSKRALMKLNQDPHYPLPRGTKTFPGFSKLCLFMKSALKSGVTHSFIEQF
ncbi:hypothetical protein H5410_041488 [Solanum commersonii]|uniref:Uncharacterized protein n=1 Tax=Solanum commersonii TaxID=4109 RepID=A0A9J5XVN7_SOLCO|nr:hypothetical protein H5410_041488 [Solanum commersonii]